MVRQMHEEGADDEELRKILIARAAEGIEMLKGILYKPEFDDERVLSSGITLLKGSKPKSFDNY